MLRKALITGMVVVGLATVQATPAFHKLEAAAANIRNRMESLDQEGSSLSPIERFVFSLVLADPKPADLKCSGTAPERRT